MSKALKLLQYFDIKKSIRICPFFHRIKTASMSVIERKNRYQVFPKANKKIPGISSERTYRCFIIWSSNLHKQMSGINFWMG